MKVHIQNPDSNMAALKRVTESHIRKFATDMSVQLYHSGPNKQNQNRRGSSVAEIFVLDSRSRKCFGLCRFLWALNLSHETGLECNQLLPRRLRNTDLSCTTWKRRGCQSISKNFDYLRNS